VKRFTAVRTVSKADARREVVSIRRIERFHDGDTGAGYLLPGRAQNEVAEYPVLLAQRREVFPPQAEIQGQVGPEFPVILYK
jgi:hypothetical protein